jgi:hypothetical protein
MEPVQRERDGDEAELFGGGLGLRRAFTESAWQLAMNVVCLGIVVLCCALLLVWRRARTASRSKQRARQNEYGALHHTI